MTTPSHTTTIESSLSRTQQKRLKTGPIIIPIRNKCGDTIFISSFGNKYIDLVLKLYTGIAIMLNNNQYIKHSCGNGTLVKFNKVVFKKTSMLTSKICNGFHTSTVSDGNIKFH